jgi:hypothetical protein
MRNDEAATAADDDDDEDDDDDDDNDDDDDDDDDEEEEEEEEEEETEEKEEEKLVILSYMSKVSYFLYFAFCNIFVTGFPVKFGLLSPGRARQRQCRAYPGHWGNRTLFDISVSGFEHFELNICYE